MSAHDRTPRYDPTEIARQIANGHAYDEHVFEQQRFTGRDNERYGPELHIDSREDFSRHIETTMRDLDTYVFEGVDRRDIYCNASTNTVVVVNLDDPHGGTCLRSKLGKEPDFIRIYRSDSKELAELGLDPPQVVKGGYDAIEQWRAEQSQEANWTMQNAVPSREIADQHHSYEQASLQTEHYADQPPPESAQDSQPYPPLTNDSPAKRESEESKEQSGEMIDAKVAKGAVERETTDASLNRQILREFGSEAEQEQSAEFDLGQER